MSLTTLFSLTTTRDTERSSITLTGVIPSSSITEVRERVLTSLAKTLTVDGFRSGEVPTSVAEQQVGSLEIWQKSAQEVLTSQFPELLAEIGVAPIGQPRLQFTAIPVGGDVSFSLSFFTLPKIDLPDYVAIAKSISPKQAEKATDEDIEQVLLDIRRSLHRKAHPEKPLPEATTSLPEITDGHIQELSSTHTDKESFVRDLRDTISSEKVLQAQAEHRQSILSAVIKETSFAVPSILVEEEFKRSYDQFKHQVQHLGTTFDAYLETQHLKKEELEKRLREEAERRSRIQLVLNAISTKEQILPDADMVEKEIVRLRDRVKDLSEEELRQYVASLLINDAVLRFLESKNA